MPSRDMLRNMKPSSPYRVGTELGKLMTAAREISKMQIAENDELSATYFKV